MKGDKINLLPLKLECLFCPDMAKIADTKNLPQSRLRYVVDS
jgi:hypothetical protein